MKKVLTLTSVLALVACGQNAKYQETGLLCADVAHDENAAEITLDVRANDNVADVVINGEKLSLNARPQSDATYVEYYGTNANNEDVKLRIVLADDAVKYMLGINSGDTTYGCVKK